MFASACRAAAFAALLCLSTLTAAAQQGPTEPAIDGYKPPARFIAKETEKPYQKPAAPGTSAAPGARGAAAPSALKTVGVISIVGGSFTVKKIGMMVFSNEEQTFPMANWKFDDKVAATVAGLIRKNFKTRRIAIPAADFGALPRGKAPSRSLDAELAKFLAKYTAGQNCDYYLLVAPGGSVVGTSNQQISGIGIVRWDSVLFAGEHIHAISKLTVYDSHMTEIRSQFGSIGEDSILEGVKGPHRELKDGERLPPEPKSAFADPRTQKIAWELLEKSLVMTVPKLLAAD